jgi:hypothetical protein
MRLGGIHPTCAGRNLNASQGNDSAAAEQRFPSVMQIYSLEKKNFVI